MKMVNVGKKPDYFPIRVSSNILLYIGSGIYHSIAGAIKELVNNSFDADASVVSIDTHYPSYETIQITDNGIGMSSNDFRHAMESIGSSIKGEFNNRNITPKYRRPIIGHLGIGLLALSQICERAIIESKQSQSKTKFHAILDFKDFQKNPSEKINEIKKENQQKKKLSEDNNVKEEDELGSEQLGYCLVYKNIPADEIENGTKIILEGIRKEVIEILKDTYRNTDGIKKITEKDLSWGEYLEDIRHQKSWEEICRGLKTAEKKITLQSLPYYYRFLWELALQTPVIYLESGPFELDQKVFAEKKAQLKSYNFSLIVDGKELFKPILLPSLKMDLNITKDIDYYIEEFEYQNEVDNELLKFTGYIYWQKEQILPEAIRGIEIYIRNVGIDTYDKELLGFTNVNPASRAGQISGEIYIEEGLERALNIDRKSFRETDSHYLEIQKYIWKKIGSTSKKDGIFGKSVEAYFERKKIKDKELDVQRMNDIQSYINKISDKNFQIEFNNSDCKIRVKSHSNSGANRTVIPG